MMRSRGSVPIAESISANRTKSIATRLGAIFRRRGGTSSGHGKHDPSVQTLVARSRFDLIPQFYDNRIDTILYFYYSRNVQADAIHRRLSRGHGGTARTIYRLGKKERGSMTPRHFNVLFLCIGNSARSIMAEAIMNRKGFPNFTGYSAGSHPTGHVSSHALKQIASGGMPIEGLRSESWDEFGKPDAPEIHFVFTVCDRQVAEPCPVWPGQPLTAQWSVPDPTAATGTDEQIQHSRSQDRLVCLIAADDAGTGNCPARDRQDRPELAIQQVHILKSNEAGAPSSLGS